MSDVGARPPTADEWEARGTRVRAAGYDVFVVDVPPSGGVQDAEPLLVIHGFPTCSYDFWPVLDRLSEHRRVVLVDLLGFGLSAKPDRRYSLALQAEVLGDVTAGLGIGELALLTHDLGDSVGGELLARQLDGQWPVEVTRRVLTNGSIYIELAHLTDGQLLLLSLPDAKLEPNDLLSAESMAASLSVTFAPGAPVDRVELEVLWTFISHDDGQLLLPRLIRYIEERRTNERRFTGAIETHPSPLTVVWGIDDPIAVPAMVDTLIGARPGIEVHRLEGVGHYPMLEAPGRFADAVLRGLS